MSSIKRLEHKIKRSEKAAGEWSGESSGAAEDRAMNALESVDRLKNKIAWKKHGIAKKMRGVKKNR